MATATPAPLVTPLGGNPTKVNQGSHAQNSLSSPLRKNSPQHVSGVRKANWVYHQRKSQESLFRHFTIGPYLFSQKFMLALNVKLLKLIGELRRSWVKYYRKVFGRPTVHSEIMRKSNYGSIYFHASKTSWTFAKR